MSDVIESFSFSKDGIDFSVSVVCYNEFALFSEMYTMTDKHQGGVTIKNPSHHRGGYKYAIPEFSLAERAGYLRDNGDPNPCASAYEAATKALERDLNASDYGFRVSASVEGVDLFNDECIGCSFDYSYDDEGTLLDIAQTVFNESAIDDAVTQAKEAVKEILSKVEVLSKINIDSEKQSDQ